MLIHCESDVNVFLPSYAGDPQAPRESSLSPLCLDSRWTCLDLPGPGSHGQSGCPGVTAHVLGPERDGYGLALAAFICVGSPDHIGTEVTHRGPSG